MNKDLKDINQNSNQAKEENKPSNIFKILEIDRLQDQLKEEILFIEKYIKKLDPGLASLEQKDSL